MKHYIVWDQLVQQYKHFEWKKHDFLTLILKVLAFENCKTETVWCKL